MPNFTGPIRTTRIALFAIAVLSACCLRASAQQGTSNPRDLEARVQQLEDVIRQLQSEREATVDPRGTAEPTVLPDAAVAVSAETKKQDPKILAGWNDQKGFILRSSDDRFNLRITGQIQGDYRAFLDGRAYTDIDSFLVRRARLGIDADIF